MVFRRDRMGWAGVDAVFVATILPAMWQVVVVGTLQGDWNDDTATQRARSLEALATADGLLVSSESILVAQYNRDFQSTLRVNEVRRVRIEPVCTAWHAAWLSLAGTSGSPACFPMISHDHKLNHRACSLGDEWEMQR